MWPIFHGENKQQQSHSILCDDFRGRSTSIKSTKKFHHFKSKRIVQRIDRIWISRRCLQKLNKRRVIFPQLINNAVQLLTAKNSLIEMNRIGPSILMTEDLISNILSVHKRKDLKFSDDYDMIEQLAGPYLLQLSYSSLRSPYFVLGTKTGLERLAQIKSLYIDMTWFRSERGIIVLSDKVQHSFYYREKEFCEGIRSFPWIFVHTKSRNNITLKEIFHFIKGKVDSLNNTNWNPLHIYVDFDGATILALKDVFPVSSIKFCFFHLLQAIRRKAVKIFGKKICLHRCQ